MSCGARCNDGFGSLALTRRQGLRGMLAMLAAIPAAGCNLLRNTDTLKFRFDLEIDTPSGIKNASSVMQAVMQGGFPIYRQIDPGTYRVRGQAPYAEIAPGKFIFVPLGQPMNTEQMLRLLEDFLMDWTGPGPQANWRESFPRAKRELPAGEVPPDRLPLIVTFGSVQQPSTVERVRPEQFGTVFGEGVRLRRAAVTIVSDRSDMSEGFAIRFPQIATHTDNFRPIQIGGPRGAHPEAGLRADYFIRD